LEGRWIVKRALIVAVLLSPSVNVSAQEKSLAVVNAVIIDGNGGPPIEDGVILIRGDRIEAVGIDLDVPAGIEVLDAAGRVAMPGLADMHVHLIGGWDGDAVDMLGYQRYLNALVYCGVTTVLDAGNVLPFVAQMRQEIEAGRIEGPRIYFVGPLIDGPDPVWPPISFSLVSTAQVPGMVALLQASGVDALKGYGGLSAVQIEALAKEGRERSLPVIVDAWRRNGANHLVTSGITAFAHAPGGQLSQRTIALMKERGVHIITTLAVTESFARTRFRDLSFLENPLIARTTPPWFLDSLRAEARRELDEDERKRASRTATRLEQTKKNVKALFDAGVLLAAGTDAPYPGVFQGEGVHRELELLVEAGLTPLEAMTVATKNAAAFMGDGSEWGTLEPGRRADVVLVRGRPDRVIGQTRNVEIVIQRGRVVDRKALAFDANRDPGFRVATPVSSH